MEVGFVAEIAAPLQKLSAAEKRFFKFISLSFGLVMMEYGIVRPASDSLFLSNMGSRRLPLAWLTTTLVLFLFSCVFSRLLKRFRYSSIIYGVGICVILVNPFMGIILCKAPGFIFVFEVWKAAYILILTEQIWALLNSTFDTAKARSLYGILTAICSVGAGAGNLVTAAVATHIGSENLLFFSIPIYGLASMAFVAAIRSRAALLFVAPQNRLDSGTFSERNGYHFLKKSPILCFILVLVCLMQVTVALTDFQFKHTLEHTIVAKDLRTKFFANIFFIVNAIVVPVQMMLVGPIIRVLGLGGTHLGIPGMLLVNTMMVLAFPMLGVVTFSYISVKIVSYGIFRVAKEILYIPCTAEEKYKTKAVIDVFAYNGIKTASSLLILGLISVASVDMMKSLTLVLIGVLMFWVLLIPKVMQAYSGKSREYENACCSALATSYAGERE